MKIEIEVIRKPNTEQMKMLRDFSKKNWGKHVDSAEDIRLNYFADIDFSIVAWHKTILIGLLNLHIKKRVIFLDEILSVGGIGGVVVHKKYRHKGVATKILKQALNTLKYESVDVAMLGTEIDRLGNLYRKVGFIPLGQPYLFIDKNGDEKKEPGGMIAAVNSKNIFNMILKSKEKLNVGVSNF